MDFFWSSPVSQGLAGGCWLESACWLEHPEGGGSSLASDNPGSLKGGDKNLQKSYKIQKYLLEKSMDWVKCWASTKKCAYLLDVCNWMDGVSLADLSTIGTVDCG